MRSAWARCVLAVVMIPLLVLGVFGGTTFLAHAHDGHHLHVHASSSVAEARLAAERHREAHASGAADCGHHHDDHGAGDGYHGAPATGDESDGFIVTVPDHEQLSSRGAELSDALGVALPVVFDVSLAWAEPDLFEDTGSPGGRWCDGPRHLCALTAGQRLVRTSLALLI